MGRGIGKQNVRSARRHRTFKRSILIARAADDVS